MPGYIQTIEISHENTTGTIDYLKGNIFQKVFAKFTIRFETWFNALTDEEIVFADPAKRTTDWMLDNTVTGRFAGFNVGDLIVVTNATDATNNGSYLISEKLNDSEVRFTDTMGGAVTLTQNLSDAAARFLLDQNPNGFTFDYGLIENAEAVNFNSKVDGNLMRYEIGVASGGLPSVNTPMIAVGKKSWQIGSVAIRNITSGGDLDNKRYIFEVTQELFIHPFYLDNQILDFFDSNNELRSNILFPPYFNLANCLKHVFRARAYRSLQDPNVFQELVFDQKVGNTGYYDEEFNGGTPEYRVRNLSYNNTIGSITRDGTTTVTFEIENLGSANVAFACTNFIVLNEKPTDYQNNNLLMTENYVFDRNYQTTGSPAQNGENFGTGYQVIKNQTITASAGFVTVSMDIEFGADAKTKLDSLTDKRFLIAVYAVDTTQPTDSSNYVTMLVDVNDLKVEVPDAAVDVTNSILFHDQNNNSVVRPSPAFKIEDELVTDSLLLLDRNNLDLQIDTVNLQIVAKKTGEDDVILQDFLVDLTQEPLVGSVRYINQTIQTPFKVNPQEIRKEIKAFRSPSQDTSGKFAYRFQYPFLYRWEDWEQLVLTVLPADFLDTNEPFNGYNQNWVRLAGLAGWSVNYRVETVVTVGSTTVTKQTDTALPVNGYESNGSYSVDLKSFDGNTLITYLGNPYIMSNKVTKFEADFINATAVGDLYLVARIIPKQAGTYIQNDSFSSVYNRENLGAFTSDGGNGLIAISNPGAGPITRGTFYLDGSLLPLGVREFTLSVSASRITTGSVQADYGEIFKRDLLALEVRDFTEPEVPKEDNPFKKCCFPLTVLADTSSTDDFKNDRTSFIEFFGLQYTVDMYLQKFVDGAWVDQTILNDGTYGDYYPLGFTNRDNKNFVGYTIEWKTVLTTFQRGKYRLRFDAGSSQEVFTEEYCLEQFSTLRADRTVRIDFFRDSVIGSKDQKVTRDFSDINWFSQIRVPESVFYGRTGEFTSEQVRLQNGRNKTIQKSFVEGYTMEVRRMPIEVRNFLIYDVLMSDQIIVTDYNRDNADKFINLEVELDSSFEPNYDDSRPYPTVELTFKDAYDNQRKLYS